jgi:putative hydrolase of the HAD superfamily
MTKRAILFDVDGVLIHGWHARPEQRHRWDANLLADVGIDGDEFGREFIPHPFATEVLTGQRSLIDALGEWLAARGHTVSPIAFAAYWFERDSRRNEELFELVARISSSGKARLFVATNQEHLRAQYLWQNVGLGTLFDDMFHAARIGVLKPDAEYFARIDRLLGPLDEPPLFYDDSEEVVAAARKAGWEAVLYDELGDCAGHPAIRRLLNA